MTDHPWWERWPVVLAKEEAAFDAAGMPWQRDDAAMSRGVLRVKVCVETPAGNQELVVVYPDNYPYFRFQVYASGLDLPLHQNPFEGNLCLLGRRTHYWDIGESAAALIAKQLPKLLTSAAAANATEAEGLEERQAEPFSAYYLCGPSMILVQTEWSIPPKHRRGTLKIGTVPSGGQLPGDSIRGSVVEIRGEYGELLASADHGLRQAFSGKQIDGQWARVNEPIRRASGQEFREELLRLHPQLKNAPNTIVKGGRLRVWGVLFPEQTAHRVMGEGWVFVCDVQADHRSNKSKKLQAHKKGRK